MTQTLAAAPTQNTAPVHEYQCLYTSDLRRKQKRWQDGFLRFHTFNKRIMVYEAPSRNYVGDKHWREEGEIQDGDELQLEKPVLVQVGEQIGSTETDLTELLEKRRKPHNKVAKDTVDSPQRQLASTAITTSTATLRQPLGQPSQLRPKTLNALLGTPKRPIGRASLPTKSPHELRHENENAEWGSDRPAKRQRIDLRPEVIPEPDSRPISRRSAHSKPCARSHEGIRVPGIAVAGSRPVQPASIIAEMTRNPGPKSKSQSSRTESDKGSVDSTLPHQVPVKKKTKLSGVESRIEPAKRLRKLGEPTANQIVEERLSSYHINESRMMIDKGPCHSTTNTQETRSIIDPIELVSEEEAASVGEPPKERMKLQMAPQKPRKKLMYRDLLPEDQAPVGRSPSLETDFNRKSRERKTSSRAVRGAPKVLTDFHQEEQDRLADRLNQYHGRTSHLNDDIESITESRAKSPGLFLSQDDPTPSPARHLSQEDRFPAIHASCTNNPSSIGPSKRSRCPSQEHTERTTPNAASTIQDTAINLSKMDEILIPRSQPSHPFQNSSPSHVIEDDSPVHVASVSSVPVTTPIPILGPTPQKVSPSTTLIPLSPGYEAQSPTLARQRAPKDLMWSKVPASNPKPPPIEEVSANTPEPEASPSVKPLPRTTASVTRPPRVSSPKRPPSIAPPEKLPPPPKAQPPRSPSPDPSPPKAAKPRPPSPKDQSPTLPSQNPSYPLRPTTTTTTTNPTLPPSPFTPPPEFDLRIAQKPLPAFQAPKSKPKPKPRSPLKKSTSDTTTMRPPPELPNTRSKTRDEGEEIVEVTNDSTSTPWSKEAWDLFGCGRDGVECSYEEFKRKEGLV
jgi:hypothetical protein